MGSCQSAKSSSTSCNENSRAPASKPSNLIKQRSASFVPQAQDDLELQLTTMLLEKALYELRYELNSRPDWVRIPLRGILDLIKPS